MIQRSLFTQKARCCDPQTSRDAADSIKAEAVSRLKAAILDAYADHGPMIDEQLCRVLVGVATPSGIRGRRSELARSGDVAPVMASGVVVTGQTQAGRAAIVWDVT